MNIATIDWQRAARFALVGGLVGSMILAPGSRAYVPAGAAGQVTLRVALMTGIDTLNPFTAVRLASTQVGRFMYEFLTTYTAGDQTPTPGLAESWSTSADGLTWTFRIRRGMTWSDGQPITARDPAFTYNLMMTNPDAATANGSYTANFASVQATDDSTLVITTRHPYASMLSLDIPVVPEHAWSKVQSVGDFTNEDTSSPVVGSGPFILTGYREGQSVTLRANDRYWRGRPAVDEVQFVTYTDTDAAVQALRKGDVDVVNGLTAKQFQALSGQPGITVNDGHNRRFSSVIVNPGAATKSGDAIGDGNPALKDVAVRRAIARAVDRQMLVTKVLQGHGQVGASIIPPVFPEYHWEPGGAERQSYDPVSGNALLDNAGYRMGPHGVRVDKAGRKLALRLLAVSGDPIQAQEAGYLAGWLADIGIQLTPQFRSDTQVEDAATGGEYDLAFSGWSVSPDPDQMLALSTCGQRPAANGRAGSTSDFFCAADYDLLYSRQAAELDPARRAEIVKRMQALLYDRAPEVVLTYTNSLEAYRSDRFAPFERQPSVDGVITGQNGYWWLYGARPTAAAATRSNKNGLAVGLAVGALVGLAGLSGIAVARRRAATADERE